MLATRELNVSKLPESSRTWINEKLVYTHGYGLTMNTVNGFTPEGLPALLLRDMPVQSATPSLTVTRPEIYFGEMTNTDVYVKTGQQEFNYPQGQDEQRHLVSGHRRDPAWRCRAAAAHRARSRRSRQAAVQRRHHGESRLLMRSNVRERVAALAPFLQFDQDPYIVLAPDGRLSG